MARRNKCFEPSASALEKPGVSLRFLVTKLRFGDMMLAEWKGGGGMTAIQTVAVAYGGFRNAGLFAMPLPVGNSKEISPLIQNKEVIQ
jgi:hypothetical protein